MSGVNLICGEPLQVNYLNYMRIIFTRSKCGQSLKTTIKSFVNNKTDSNAFNEWYKFVIPVHGTVANIV